MKKTCILLALCFAILMSGCTKIFLYSYGVRNPKIENKKSVTAYLQNKKLKTENTFALSDIATLSKFNQSNIGMPEIRFYDTNGYLMLYRDNKKCNAQNDSLISFLDPTNVIQIDSTNNILDYLKQLKTLDGKNLDLADFKHYDFYLVMYWAKWIGKVNTVKMLDWEKSLSYKADLKLKTIKVTTDYMDFWHINKKDMAKVYSFKTKIGDKKKERTQ